MHIKLILPLLILQTTLLFSQQYPRGLSDEPDTMYSKIEEKALMSGYLYRDLQPKSSLKKFTPYPGWQDYGTCAAFASAYSARTILEAQNNNWTDRTKITENAFSPGFLFKITNSDSRNCNGAYTSEVLNNLVQYGSPKKVDFPTECPGNYPNRQSFDKALPYKIKGFVRLFNENAAQKTKVSTVKKSISEGNPVVISMICPKSFDGAKDVWNPVESPDDNTSGRQHGRHAVCVVGYDDTKHGGAFEILNSWGKSWGNEGFIWIRYTDFATFVYQGFEVLSLDNTPEPAPTPAPTPKPAPAPVVNNLNGELRMMDVDSKTIGLSRVGQSRTYKVSKPLPSGTRFRLYLTNSQPAFVYLLGWDNSKKIFTLFPYDPSISPALTYSKNEVAIPDESHHIRLDNTQGKDVMALIYSKKKLDMKTLVTSLQSTSGPVETRLIQLLGNDLAPANNVTYDKDKIKFTASNISQQMVLTLIEIDHL